MYIHTSRNTRTCAYIQVAGRQHHLASTADQALDDEGRRRHLARGEKPLKLGGKGGDRLGVRGDEDVLHILRSGGARPVERAREEHGRVNERKLQSP